MEIKKYIDIENLRDCDIDLGNGMMRPRNDFGFSPGDLISITEKVDGSNASMRYDVETKTLKCFSRRLPLTWNNTLNGFYNFVESLNAEDYADVPNYSIFGEWLVKNKITYKSEFMKTWYVYSIYDNDTCTWLDQDTVKEFVKKHNLTYVHELYVGPFISWEHCRTFAHNPMYGDTQEGIVIRNISVLANKNHRYPHILKIVNAEFTEVMKARVVDPAKAAAKSKAQAMLEGVVTRNRIEKLLHKMMEDGIIPSVITPNNMKDVARNLPRLAYEDCMKEEQEIMIACGENAGKVCSSLTMQIAREILLGSYNH